MASLANDPNGRRRLIVTLGGRRHTIRLGKLQKRDAQTIRVHVENLAAAKLRGRAVPDETAIWLGRLDTTLRGKLEKVGLLRPGPSGPTPTLGQWLDTYVAMRTDVKPTTRTVYGRVRGHLLAYFGPDRLLKDITPGDADGFALYLRTTAGLAENTARRHMGIARQFLRAAVRRKMLSANPLDGQAASTVYNGKRFHYIEPDDAQKVLDACHDAQWRLLFALTRFLGLRCPSEVLGLTWADVDWERLRLTVHAPKTEHHPGRDRRIVPILPHVLPLLQEVFDQAAEGERWMISRYRDQTMNLRTQLMRIIDRAGLKPWPKLFHNLRASAEIDLSRQFPLHVVCEWLGHGPRVALMHYVRVTDADYEQATGAAQKAAHPLRENACKRVQQGHGRFTRNAVNAHDCTDLRPPSFPDTKHPVGGTGLEPVTSCMSSRRSSQLS